MVLLLAFSLTDRVEKYGAYVGVAAFFGLAVLTILYFAQARELKRLREWAGRAPERAREAEERVVAQAEAARRVQSEEPAAAARTPAPVAVGVGAATAAGAASAAATPAQAEDPQATQEHDVVEGPVEADGTGPADGGPEGANGSSADADADAETDSDEDAATATEDESEEEEAPDAEADAAAEEESDEDEAEDEDEEEAAAEPAAPPGPAVPSGSNGTSSSPVRPGEIPPASSVPRATPAQTPRPRPAPLAASVPSQTFTAREPAGPGGRRPAGAGTAGEGRTPGPRAVALAGIAVLVAAALVFAGTRIFGGSDEPPAPNQAAETTPAPADSAEGGTTGAGADRPAPAKPDRPGTTVAVLNGTFSSGLAGTTADKVARAGYKRGTTGNFTDQNRSASVIYYADGARTEGRDVGRILKISDVQAMDSQTQQVGEGADVVVVTGSDQAP
jgi:LytR cell envelope-related transcriptional attenuator